MAAAATVVDVKTAHVPSSEEWVERIRTATHRMEIGRGTYVNITIFRLRTGLDVIVKATQMDRNHDDSAWVIPASYRRELEIMASLGTGDYRKTYILPMIGHYQSEDGRYGCIVMPYAGMFTFRSATKINALERFFSPDLARMWTSQIIRGLLNAAKIGICHATVETVGRTGVEMEALTAVAAALLTVYDMCKAIDRGMQLTDIRLLEKRGGKTGDWVAK